MEDKAGILTVITWHCDVDSALQGAPLRTRMAGDMAGRPVILSKGMVRNGAPYKALLLVLALSLICVVAALAEIVQGGRMRKTSDIIWQDVQHQVLFEILDLIREPGAGREAIRRLQDYTDTHFAMEERYMELLDFPGRDAHVRAHDRFREEIENLVASTENPDSQFMDIVGTFLTEWLTRHVFGIDKELEAFILASDAK